MKLEITTKYSEEDKCYIASVGDWNIAHGDSEIEAIEEALKALANFVESAPGEIKDYVQVLAAV